MKCIIIEDQAPARRLIQKYVSDYNGLELIGSFSSAIEVLDLLKEQTVDLIFLDVHLPQLSGIDFIKSLKNPPSIILTTAFTEYAVLGYELDIVDYLVKPISFERFVQAVNKIETKPAHNESKSEKNIFVKSGHDYVKIDPSEILFIKSDMDYTELHFLTRKIISSETLSHWADILHQYEFVRVHRSYLANVSQIIKVSRNSIHYSDSHVIPIGRAYKSDFHSNYLKFEKTN